MVVTTAEWKRLQQERSLVRVERSKLEPGHVDARVVGVAT